MLHINCDIMLVVVNNTACPICLSLVLETTCSIKHLISCASMPKAIEIIACSAFTGHLSDEFLLSSTHSYDRHVKYNLSHSNDLKTLSDSLKGTYTFILS